MMLDRMHTGRFKVFEHLVDWWDEFCLYHRKDGRIVKQRDDLMAAIRYAVMELSRAKTSDGVQDWSKPIKYPANGTSPDFAYT